jgi:large exoprotein involved in heme utilization and adhesion
MTDGGLVVTTVFSDGNGGDVNINANTISIIGRRAGSFVEGTTGLLIENNQSAISSVSYGKGTAGNTSIVANNLILDGRGGITAGTGNKGAAGNINVTVKKLFLGAGSEINSSSGGFFGKKLFIGQGPGGNIHVIATDNITISGQDDRGLPSAISTNSLGIGQGGDVKVQTNHLNINDGGVITANAMGTGNAGNVVIQANTINLSGNGTITTSSEHATGGNITITVPNRLFLQEGQITTSVHGGTGDGGNITIENPVFVVMNNGQIIAQANEGRGGNIRLSSKQLVKSPCSQISASSKLGIDGDVNVESPEVNMDDLLVVLPGGTRPEAKFSTRCHFEDWDDLSTFVVRIAGDGRPRLPDNHME